MYVEFEHGLGGYYLILSLATDRIKYQYPPTILSSKYILASMIYF